MKLKPHPVSPPSPVEEIDVKVSRPHEGRLLLEFTLRGDVGRLLLPESPSPGRRDELWRHTCLEAFVGSPFSEAYAELNVSPSGDWAAYRFSGYRKDMANAEIPSPTIIGQVSDWSVRVEALFDLATLSDPSPDGEWRLALSAVIEAKDGSLSYWAQCHPAQMPDFHHPDCFALKLRSAGRS